MKICPPVFLAALLVLSQTQANAQSETVATAAKKAFDQGEFERIKGNHAGAVTLLETAVRLAPENPLYHHRLGKACLDAEKYDAMWVHFRRAAFLDHQNEEYATDFMNVWFFHDRQGVLNTGTPSSVLMEKMGKPDKRVENDSMKRWIYAFIAVDFGQDKVFRVIDLRGYTPDAADEPEQVKVQTNPQEWKVSHHMISRRDDNLELTPPGEHVQNWSEMFSKQRFPLMSKTTATVRGMADSMHQSLQASAALVKFEVLSETPTSIVYHWRTKTNEKNPAQHEIAKLIKGQKDFYRIAYVKKTDQLSEAEFADWSKVIGNATLVPRNANSKENSIVPPKKSTDMNIRLASWELGKNLGFAALLRGRHGPDAVVKETLMRVSRNAHLLNVTVPAPDALTDDASADTASAIHFLLDTAGKPIYLSLEKDHGDESAALFELGTKTTLLSLLYQAGDSTSESFAVAIERAARKAKLDPSVWQSLVNHVSDGSSTEDVRKAIEDFQKQMRQL